MSWLSLILMSVFCSAFTNILQKKISSPKEISPIAQAIIFQILGGIFIAFYAVIFTKLDLRSFFQVQNKFLYVSFLLSSILYASSTFLIFLALKKVDASKFTLLFSLRAVVTIFLSTIFLNEGLTKIQLIGAILILLSIFFVTFRNWNIFELNKYDLYSLIAAVCYGIAGANDKYLLDYFNLYPLLIFGFIVPGIILLIFNISKSKQLLTIFHRKELLNIFTYTVLYVVGSLTFFNALVISDNVSIISGINQIGTVLTVLMGVLILKETANLNLKILGTIISTIGLLLII